jgi:hypothetical protein
MGHSKFLKKDQLCNWLFIFLIVIVIWFWWGRKAKSSWSLPDQLAACSSAKLNSNFDDSSSAEWLNNLESKLHDLRGFDWAEDFIEYLEYSSKCTLCGKAAASPHMSGATARWVGQKVFWGDIEASKSRQQLVPGRQRFSMKDGTVDEDNIPSVFLVLECGHHF